MSVSEAPQPVMTVEELNAFMAKAFPHSKQGEGHALVERIEPMEVQVRLSFSASQLRPGGTISGPTMMTLADHAMYAVVLAHIGPVALAVTTNLNINFLQRPTQEDLIGTARILKLGQKLVVGEVTIGQASVSGPVAHATLTYSVPPERYRHIQE